MSSTVRRIAVTIAALVAAAAMTAATATASSSHQSPRLQADDHSLCC